MQVSTGFIHGYSVADWQDLTTFAVEAERIGVLGRPKILPGMSGHRYISSMVGMRPLYPSTHCWKGHPGRV